MQSIAYQMLSLGARPLFLFLAVVVMLRAAFYLLREHHSRRQILRTLPDAGMVGEMRDVESDKAYPLPREGILGSGRSCDIRLPGIKRRHLNFAFIEGKGILLTPCSRASSASLNGRPLQRGAYALHGALLQAGGYTLRIRLFAGLNVPHPAAFQELSQPVFEEELFAPELPQNDPCDMPAPYEVNNPALYVQQPAVPFPLPDSPQPPSWYTDEQEGELPPQSEGEYPVYPEYTDDMPEESDVPLPYDAPLLPPVQEAVSQPPETPRRHRRSDRRRML